jgi:hypothetical protein
MVFVYRMWKVLEPPGRLWCASAVGSTLVKETSVVMCALCVELSNRLSTCTVNAHSLGASMAAAV